MWSRFVIFGAVVIVFLPRILGAQPIVDRAIGTGGEPIKIYADRQNTSIYWYIPQSVEPWKRDDKYKSQLVKKAGSLTFVFRGQASADPDMLARAAKAIPTNVKNLTPIAYDYSRNLVCQSAYVGEKIQWIWPKMIGNYLEVVPVTIRTTDSQLADELAEFFEGNGLACTVEVGFKAVYTAYNLKMTADMNRIYDKFQAAAHAEGFWWEVDIAATLQSLKTDGIISFEIVQDASIPNTPLDKQVQAATDAVVKKVTEMMFTPALKLPDGDLVGRGKPWSLRASYARSEERAHWVVELNSKQIGVKDTQISLRLALK